MGLFIDHSDASGAGRAGLAGAARGGLAGAQRGGLALQASRLLVILGSFPAVFDRLLVFPGRPPGCASCPREISAVRPSPAALAGRERERERERETTAQHKLPSTTVHTRLVVDLDLTAGRVAVPLVAPGRPRRAREIPAPRKKSAMNGLQNRGNLKDSDDMHSTTTTYPRRSKLKACQCVWLA